MSLRRIPLYDNRKTGARVPSREIGMPATRVIVALIGQIALLTWGIHMVRSGMLRALGGDLRRLLAIALRSRLHAFAAGAAVTAALQSSTATALMTTSFLTSGVIALVPALAVMLGANVGSTLIVQLLSFDVGWVYPLLITSGVVLFRRFERAPWRDLGRVAIGLGLMLLALHLMADTMRAVETAEPVTALLRAITGDPLLNLILAATMTWLVHSSVVVMLFVMSLADSGAVTVPAALAMVLGANLGSAVNPLLAATGGGAGRLRLPLGNLAARALACALALPFLGPLARIIAAIEPAAPRIAADFHLGLNLALAAVLLAPLPTAARLLTRLLPERGGPPGRGAPLHLVPAGSREPSVALANAARETLRMADTVAEMLGSTRELLHKDDRRRVAELRRLDDVLDGLRAAIERYLTETSHTALSANEQRRLNEILAFVVNLEHVGDIIDRNLLDLLSKRIKGRLSLAAAGVAEFDAMHVRLLTSLQLAVAVFIERDLGAARRLFADKERFRELERDATERHFARLRGGEVASIETGGLQLDLIRDLKRIEAHIAAAAHPLLEEEGVLRPTRLTC